MEDNTTIRAKALRATVILTLGLLSAPSLASPEPRNWPLWPQEIELHRQVLASVAESTDARRQALISLLTFPEPVRDNALRTALAAQNSDLHRDALRLCAELRSASCREQARAYIETRPAPALALAALPAAIAGLDGEAQAFLFALTEDRDPTLRLAALRELNHLGRLDCTAGDCLKQILPRLLDADAEVRRLSLQLLGTHGTADLSPAISSLLRDPDPDVRLACVVALGRVADPRSTELLVRQLEGAGTAELAEATLLALVQIPGLKIDTLLKRLLLDQWVPEALSYEAVLRIVGLRAKPGAELRATIVGMIRRAGHDKPNEREQILALLAATAFSCRSELEALLDSGALDARSTAEVRDIVAMTDISTTRSTPDKPATPMHFMYPWAAGESNAPTASKLATLLLSGQHPSGLQLELVHWITLHLNKLSKARQRPAGLEFSERTQKGLEFQLMGWVQQRQLDAGTRCLALSAYVAWRAKIPTVLQDAIDRDPGLTVHACRAQLWAYAREYRRLEQALHDPRVPVRRAAVLGLWHLPPGPLRRRWARKAMWDPDPSTRDEARTLLKSNTATRSPWRLQPRDKDARTWSFYDARSGRHLTLVPGPLKR